MVVSEGIRESRLPLGCRGPYRVSVSSKLFHGTTHDNIISVSLEVLTVLGAGPMACYILKQLAANDPARHYWIVVLCTAEIYGGYVLYVR